VIERALALCEGPEIHPEDLPLPDEETPSTTRLGETLVGTAIQRQLELREVEDLYIQEILRLTGGNKVHAARILGINRRTLYRRGERSTPRRDPVSDGANA
jgi:DNA-binding NtrC family response regulator